MSKMSTILKQIINAYPHQDKLKIRDMAKVGSMIENIVAKGSDSLQVITDFDFTLTKARLPDGSPASSGPGVMSSSPLMSEDFRTQVNELVNKYRPIEFDHKLPLEQKIPLILEWYKKKKEVVIASKFNKNIIDKIVKTCNVVLRDGAGETLAMLNDKNVPVLIFSAGNGDIIESVMKRDGALFPNSHIISNFYKFDEKGFVIDYMNPTLLHVFNKNEHAVENLSYFQDLSHRPNALVLGDHLADVSMSDGMPDPGTILKIGFLNDPPIEETLKVYQDEFDVVLIDDQTFDFINGLLRFVL